MFSNLIKNLEISRINQVWQSDITYYNLNGRSYYITFIIDAFSRVIVGYSVSKRLTTEQTVIAALKKALKLGLEQILSQQVIGAKIADLSLF